MAKPEAKCIFCGNEAYSEGNIFIDNLDVYCPVCGDYSIDRDSFDDLPNMKVLCKEIKGYIISGYLREMNELGLKPEVISTMNIESFYSNSKIPKSVHDKLDKILLYIYRRTEYIYQEIEIKSSDYAIGYAMHDKELRGLLGALQSMDYIRLCTQFEPSYKYSLTLDGFQKAESLTKKNIESTQAFVAMWFSDEMLDIYNNYISKAIIDAGYAPMIVSNREHLGKICDQIIAEIKKSKFLVADFTGQRGGVYYEAGFAHGLNLPVIWTCRQDWFDGVITKNATHLVNGTEQPITINEKAQVHFDIRQYNFIVWSTPEELYEKLKYRILATISK